VIVCHRMCLLLCVCTCIRTCTCVCACTALDRDLYLYLYLLLDVLPPPSCQVFLRRDGTPPLPHLKDVIATAKPHGLIGLSGHGPAFFQVGGHGGWMVWEVGGC
jgi:hypothetical protein